MQTKTNNMLGDNEILHNTSQRCMAFPALFNHADITECINNTIQLAKQSGQLKNAKDISDGYHTFDELYETLFVLNRMAFRLLAREWTSALSKNPVWRSKLHSDGSMFDDMFIVGAFGLEWHKPGTQVSFHYHLDKWDEFHFAQELTKAPKWDGHTPADVLQRLKRL